MWINNTWLTEPEIESLIEKLNRTIREKESQLAESNKLLKLAVDDLDFIASCNNESCNLRCVNCMGCPFNNENEDCGSWKYKEEAERVINK